jgi:lipopolysaccharide export system permease protein
MSLLDRYVLRNFLEPFLICFLGFIGIWLVFDLGDNGSDFIEHGASLKQVAQFYLFQLPQTVLISLPIGLLLALLYSLSRMSRSNEIIAMLTAGRSVVRVLVPLMAVGLLLSGVCFALNYRWAPQAEAVRETMLEQINRGKKAEKDEPIEGHLFRDRQHDRTWYVRKMRVQGPKVNELDGVHIVQQDPEGNVIRKWYAEKAFFDAKGTWALHRGMAVEFNVEGDIVKKDDFAKSFRVVNDWPETPWRIASSLLEAGNLSVPQLEDYLKYNSDFPTVQLASYRTNLADRWAFPLSCFVVIFIAAPLGIVFSRRGVLAGVAGSIFIFFGMILLRYLFLALGKGARIDPVVAAWLPNVFFMTIGLFLLYLRSTNRELPRLFGRR